MRGSLRRRGGGRMAAGASRCDGSAGTTRTVRSDASVVVGARDRVGGGGPTCRAERHDSPWKSRMR